ncbi:MAG: hypothetical protein AAF771_09545 [Pseudomonadota bacterium]
MAFLREPPAVAVFFTVDSIQSEAQSVLLATTLRARNGRDLSLTAYVTPDHAPEMRRITRRSLRHLDVGLAEIDPSVILPGAEAAPRPPSNILAACMPRAAAVHFLVSTDIVALAPVSFEELAGPGDVSACRFGHGPPPGGARRWAEGYERFGLVPPEDRVAEDPGGGFPGFDTGLVGWHDGASGAAGLPELWLDTARVLQAEALADKAAPQASITQIALPIAAMRAGRRMRALSPAHCVSLGAYEASAEGGARFVRYRSLGDLWGSPLGAEVLDICAELLPPPLWPRFFAQFAEVLELPGPREALAG